MGVREKATIAYAGNHGSNTTLWVTLEGAHPSVLKIQCKRIIFTCRAFSRHFYNQYICQKKVKHYGYCGYSKDVHRTKCKALTITRLTRAKTQQS